MNSLLLPQKRNLRGGGSRGALEIAFVNKGRGSEGHKEFSLREKQTSVPAREIIKKSQHSPVSQAPREKRQEEGCGVRERWAASPLDQLPLLLTTLLRGATLKTCYS